MKKEDYLETLVIHGQMVNLGINDYGQCYYFEYVDSKTNKIIEVSCGTYNPYFYEAILHELDYKGYIVSLYGQDCWDEYLHRLAQKNIIINDPDDYEIYDIEEFYKWFYKKGDKNKK